MTILAAYGRLTGQAQHDLRNKTAKFLQKNYFEEGKFRNILGSYQMASNGKVTGDNSEIYYTSPYQEFSNEKIFSLAAKLANLLRQESIAVFIPSAQAPSSDIILKFSVILYGGQGNHATTGNHSCQTYHKLKIGA